MTACRGGDFSSCDIASAMELLRTNVNPTRDHVKRANERDETHVFVGDMQHPRRVVEFEHVVGHRDGA